MEMQEAKVWNVDGWVNVQFVERLSLSILGCSGGPPGTGLKSRIAHLQFRRLCALFQLISLKDATPPARSFVHAIRASAKGTPAI